jgi:Cof subfamily protein (haloacid dehalogenase superfamily)
MSKYIIALDLDETLLDVNLNLSSYTLEILNKCKERGMIIVISSTRGYGSCKKIAQQINADYCCVQSGNSIIDSNGQILYSNAFPKEEIKNFINAFPNYINNFLVDSDDGLFGNSTERVMTFWGAKQCRVFSIADINVYKMCIHFEPEYKEEIEEYCKQKGFVCRTMRTDDFLLITPPNSDKFYALEKLVKINNTNLDHLLVFGDDNSDLLSIKMAKYGVAVKNAKESVLEIAKYVTDSNNDDGVAKFLDKFLNELQ